MYQELHYQSGFPFPRASGSKMKRSRAAAFGLIEMLIVVAIGVILIALSLPTYKQMLTKTNAARCLSNEMQIGKAMLLYTSDNDGQFPLPYVPIVGIGGWYKQIRPYLSMPASTSVSRDADNQYSFNGIFRCPSKSDWNPNGTATQQVSYAMNTFEPNTYSPTTPTRIAAISQPSKTALITEISSGSQNIPNALYIYKVPCQRHSDGDNILFCDGHVQFVRKNGLSYELILP